MVSLIVAIVLLSVGILGVSQVLATSVSMQTGIDVRTVGLDIARSYMEEVRVRDPLALASEYPVQVDESGEETTGGMFRRGLMVESVSEHLMRVTVTVTSPRFSPVVLVTLLWDGEV
jgi:type IV pilus assembly protein PilV